MTELSQRARDVLESARGADEPTLADQARVRDAMLAKIGGAAGAATVSETSALATAALKWGVVGLVGVGLVVGGLLLSRLKNNADIVPVRSPSVATAQPELHTSVATPTPAIAAPKSQVNTQPPKLTPAAKRRPRPKRSTQSKSPAASKVRATGNLREEAQLIARAQRALRAGDHGGAMSVLKEHRKTYPRGVLVQERMGLEILALCGLGHTKAAQARSESFLARWPTTPIAERLRRSCAHQASP